MVNQRKLLKQGFVPGSFHRQLTVVSSVGLLALALAISLVSSGLLAWRLEGLALTHLGELTGQFARRVRLFFWREVAIQPGSAPPNWRFSWRAAGGVAQTRRQSLDHLDGLGSMAGWVYFARMASAPLAGEDVAYWFSRRLSVREPPVHRWPFPARPNCWVTSWSLGARRHWRNCGAGCSG